MRTLDEARTSWQALAEYRNLKDLKQSVRSEGQKPGAIKGIRSSCWKIFLVFDTLDRASWQKTLTSSRSAYNTLRSHFLKDLERPDEFGAGTDPLSQDAESSPWTKRSKDEELRAEILQDVERLPEKAFYQKADTQRMLTDLLFIFCKLNPDIGYRQGMHELAAPILYVVENNAIDVGESSKALGEDAEIKACFDADHIEHDAFTLFGQIMQNAKSFYLSEGESSIASRSRHIFDELLPQIDPELASHLRGLDVLPQVYLIRWIRLLFSREFEFEEVLSMWDVIFAEDTTLEIVDHVSLVMLLNVRWQLLDSDYNAALSILLKYPRPNDKLTAQSFVTDALYLRMHFNTDGAGYLVLKYTDRPLPRPGRPSTPPALQRNMTTLSGLIRSGSPGRRGPSYGRNPRQTRNFEAMLQSTAKNIYERSEKLGISKVVRNAVDEVHKKAQEIRDAQVTSPPPWRKPVPAHLDDRIHELQLRNRRLAELLTGAVSELWECQRTIVDQPVEHTEGEKKDNIEKLSAAIAKVQFVQVYLDDVTLILPEEEGDKAAEAIDEKDATLAETAHMETTTEKSISTERDQPPSSVLFSLDNDEEAEYDEDNNNNDEEQGAVHYLADPSSFEDGLVTPSQLDGAIPATTENGKVTNQSNPLDLGDSLPAQEKSPSRPPLAQSSYSFMLGQTEPLRQADPFSPEHSRAKGSLFGSNGGNASTQGVRSKGPVFGKEGSKSVDEEAEFDLSSLRRARRANG